MACVLAPKARPLGLDRRPLIAPSPPRSVSSRASFPKASASRRRLRPCLLSSVLSVDTPWKRVSVRCGAVRDWYQVLGVARSATTKDIKARYRRLARRYHPDVDPSEEASRVFRELTNAYEALIDEKLRAELDARLRNTSATRDTKGEDLKVSLTVPFANCVTGGRQVVSARRLARCWQCDGHGADVGGAADCTVCRGKGVVARFKRTGGATDASGGAGAGPERVETTGKCPACNGHGTKVVRVCPACRGGGRAARMVTVPIRLPAGLEDGAWLRVRGQGNEGTGGGPSGDLLVKLVIEAGSGMRRRGLDVVSDMEVPLWDAMLGTTQIGHTCHGPCAVTVPPGCQDGHELRVPGGGVRPAASRGAVQGSHVFRARLILPHPDDMSEEELELLEALRGEGGECAAVGRAEGRGEAREE
ncbi:unnamed protein product [Pedinophyceae sp. YPF-701]|nr:unnamed protein product [Pedinophyceae sp. YPF-701]